MINTRWLLDVEYAISCYVMWFRELVLVNLPQLILKRSIISGIEKFGCSSMRKICYSIVIVFFLTCASVGLTQSADEDIYLSFGGEEFVSIATGQRQTLANAPAVATVITAKEIEELGAANLDEVLATVPGLHVSLSSGWFSPIYSIRGIHTDKNPQVLMLINGTPLTQLQLGDRGPKSTLPVSSIARVEVIRGPGSAVYGADAFAGVINVITKTVEQIGGTDIGLRFGSFDTKQAWISSGNTLGDVDFVFNLDYIDTSGDSDRVIDLDAQSIFDDVFMTSASLAPSAVAVENRRADIRFELAWKEWSFSVWNWRQETQTGPGIALALDDRGEGKSDNYLVDFGYKNLDSFNDWEISAKLSYMDINQESKTYLNPKGALLPLGEDGNINLDVRGLGLFTDGMRGNPESYEEHTRFDLATFYSGFNAHTLRIAAGFVHANYHAKEEKNFGPGVDIFDSCPPEPGMCLPQPAIIDGELTDVTGTQYIYLPDKSRRNYYGSLQDEWAFADDWQLTVGLRYDYFSDFGSTVNPRAALVWHTRQDLSTKFLYGRAFRAPSIAELFIANNPVIEGNEDLDPETIDTFEVAFDYRPVLDLRSGLNLFYYQIDDLIEFRATEGEGTTRFAQNTSGQTGYGFELEAEWLLSERLAFAGHYAYQYSEFEEPKEKVGLAPTSQLYGEIRWEFYSNWNLNPRAKWVSGRSREPGDQREKIADYTWATLVLRRKDLFNHIDFSVIVDNLFDADAYEPSPGESAAPNGSLVPGDFPLSGRSIYISAVYHFRY